MKRIGLLIVFSAALLMVSCNGKKQNPDVVPAPEAGMVFSGSIAPLTRSTFVDNTLTTLKWDNTDNIGIYTFKAGTVDPAQILPDGQVSPADAAVNPDFSTFQKGFGAIAIDAANPSLATFTATKSAEEFMPATPADGVDDVYAFYAYYPVTTTEVPTPAAYSGDYGVALSVSDVQASGSETSFGQYQICAAGEDFSSLYARSALLAGSNRVDFQFAPVTALIRFRMQTTPENTKTYTVSQLKMTLDQGNLSGDVVLYPQNNPYPASGEAAWPLVSVATGAAAHSVAVAFDSNLTLGNDFTDYYLAVVVPTNDSATDMTMTFVAYDEDGQPVLSTTKTLPKRGEDADARYGFRPGKIYTLDLQLDEFTAEAVAGKYNVFDWE